MKFKHTLGIWEAVDKPRIGDGVIGTIGSMKIVSTEGVADDEAGGNVQLVIKAAEMLAQLKMADAEMSLLIPYLSGGYRKSLIAARDSLRKTITEVEVL